jgi:phenylalanyl-tRNA synthetase beta chain
MNEVYNYSFVGEEQLKKLGIDTSPYIRLQNPISSHQNLLRQNLSPNMMEAIKINQARYKEVRLFEIGRVYLGVGGEMKMKPKSTRQLPLQEKRLCLAVAADNKTDVLAEIKGVVEYLLTRLKLSCRFEANEMQPHWSDKCCAVEINCQGQRLGFINQVSRIVAQKIQLKKKTVLAEINLEELLALSRKSTNINFREFEKYPPLMRDIALEVDEKAAYNDLFDTIINFHEYISDLELFDIYRGDQIGAGKKSLAFHLVFQAGKTLQSTEIDAIQQSLIKELENKFEAKVRE